MHRNGNILAVIFSLIFLNFAHAQGITPVGGSGGGTSTGANPTATAGPTAVNGSAVTFLRSDGAPAVQKGSNAQFGIVEGDGSTVTCVLGICSAINNGTVTSIATSCGISGGPITATGTISSNSNPTVQSGSNYAFLTGDCGSIVYLSNGSNQIPTIPQAGTTGFATGWYVEACNIGAGTQTITPATSTIGGAATFVLPAGSAAAPKCVGINSDGTNYKLDLTGPYTIGTAASAATGTSGATLPFLNGINTWSGTQTFGTVIGTVSTQSGTTYTIVAADCGTMVRFTNAAAVTVTIPQGLATGCNIAIEQTTAAGQVAVNGSAVTPATLHSAHSYTKTFGQWAIIGVSIESSNVAILTGDGA